MGIKQFGSVGLDQMVGPSFGTAWTTSRSTIKATAWYGKGNHVVWVLLICGFWVLLICGLSGRSHLWLDQGEKAW